jgi:2-polyprenyl-3-methyl-5-hydroxy-6-metoxy-1,4-benzoquinol methylase
MPDPAHAGSAFDDAEQYDLSINWDARLAREIPVLREAFGPPGAGGILDAGCGTGRQAIALAQAGYRVTAIDASEEMLSLARTRVAEVGVGVAVERLRYEELAQQFGRRFDGMHCVGNSLAAAGNREAARGAIENFANVLRPGGRLFIQVLNFPPMRTHNPCVRGPRITMHGGATYVSSRLFYFEADRCLVTNVTHSHERGWKQHARTGVLYPITPAELTDWCERDGIRVDQLYGSYAREPFDPDRSIDLILVGTAGARGRTE